jgi:hypothetical protein
LELLTLAMSDRGLSPLAEADWIGSAIKGKRAVFYEEMAEYSLRYSGGSAVLTSVDSESQYHINNLILLSMYFDIVFINTSVLFNLTDPFVKKVIQRTISHSQFRAMMKAGVIRVCGWGGKSPREMFSSALDFASAATEQNISDQYLSGIIKLFLPSNVVYRSEKTPDAEATDTFRRHLHETEIIRRVDDLTRVERAIAYSERLTGQLVSVSFNAALRSEPLPEATRLAISANILSSWCDHLNNSIPGIYCYAQGPQAQSIHHTISINGKVLRSFLYSPLFFASFLRKYFSLFEYDRIMCRPYEELARLRNGDWKRFCDAYHAAIETISDSISHTDFAVQPVFEVGGPLIWGDRIFELANKKDEHFDIVAFIESLASLSGVLLSIPFLGSAFRVASALVGQKIRTEYQKLLRERGSGISPYIKKVRMSIELKPG